MAPENINSLYERLNMGIASFKLELIGGNWYITLSYHYIESMDSYRVDSDEEAKFYYQLIKDILQS